MCEYSLYIEHFKNYPGINGGFYVTVLRVQHLHIRGGELFSNGGFHGRCMIFKIVFLGWLTLVFLEKIHYFVQVLTDFCVILVETSRYFKDTSLSPILYSPHMAQETPTSVIIKIPAWIIPQNFDFFDWFSPFFQWEMLKISKSE